MDIKANLEQINSRIAQLDNKQEPIELYEPIDYIMSLGGKRLRPLLVTIGNQLFTNDLDKALDPAVGLEVFHNFTLVHDDIMDEAPLRRGKETVHTKWDDNRAILSGDVMLIQAYQLVTSVDPSILSETLAKFSLCAKEVCEGQQMDMNFETRDNVTVDQYLEMIKLKTAVLLGFSLELGAIVAQTSDSNKELLKQFGTHIGVGFQLKDDLLDVYADKDDFGKQVGGDIIANKKTFLLITALEDANEEQKSRLEALMASAVLTEEDKILKVSKMKELYAELNIEQKANSKMNEEFDRGFSFLDQVQCSSEQKEALRAFSYNLIERIK